MSKSIYTFTIEKVSKVSEKTKEKYKDEKGQEKERTITEEIEKKIPVEVLVKKPNRRQMQEAEMVFSIEMSRCIKMGVLTKAMLLNKYTDSGGLVSEKDQNILDEAYTQHNDLRKEIDDLSAITEEKRTKKQKEQLSQKQKKVISLQKRIVESESSYLTLFNHTADTKAQNKIIMWYILFLTYYKDPTADHEDFVPFFEGEDYDAKEEFLYALEENDNVIYKEVYPKLATILSFWYFSGTSEKADFDKALEDQHEQKQE